ncbi:MAG: hypothetical protein QG608_1552 [Actinomycetota bacterium]|nr:hypothetical protein [Actinomycetota bacterium]
MRGLDQGQGPGSDEVVGVQVSREPGRSIPGKVTDKSQVLHHEFFNGLPPVPPRVEFQGDRFLGDMPLWDGSLVDGSLVDGSLGEGPLWDVPLWDGSLGHGSLGDGFLGDGFLGDGSPVDGSLGHGFLGEGPLWDVPLRDGSPGHGLLGTSAPGGRAVRRVRWDSCVLGRCDVWVPAGGSLDRGRSVVGNV